MLYTIENECLAVSVSTSGAELQSVKGKSGCEYLWQGDAAYWKGRAPVLFPFIGRLEGRQYQLDGHVFSMGIHGFAASAEFAPVKHTADTLVLTLCSTLATRIAYPYEFVLEITYRLSENTLFVENRVVNRSGSIMHFALGGHPGFRVPLAEEEQFGDYYLKFGRTCQPERIGFTGDTILVSGENTPYPLEEGDSLSLHHDLFDEDAVILQKVAREVTLTSRKSGHGVMVSYPDMPYLGIWHMPHTDAPYVCIEPWTSLPGRSGVTEDIALREDFIHLPAGETYENIWTITVSEGDED